MVADFVAGLERGVSRPRLARYRPEEGSDLGMLVNYFWNIELSEALYPGLAVLEVTLRSSIHEALTAREGTDMWFRELLEPGQLRSYADAYLALLNKLKGKHPSSGQIVAELTFGFWTTLLSQPYHQRLWGPHKTALVKAVFPFLPPTPSNRHFVHQRYNELRLLRNRVMHHEPIWRRPRLLEEWRDMIECVGWFSPTAKEGILLLDHFEDTYLHGRGRIEGKLRQRLGV